MATLFDRTIDSWDAWAQVYCDREAFAPLVRAIYAKEGLPEAGEIGGLTPGTNAVFRVGDTVIKIFAPQTAGFDSSRDFAVEAAMLRYAAKKGIPTSDLLRIGLVEDAYTFRYLILRHVEGVDAGKRIPGLSVEEKRRLALAMRDLCDALHRPDRDLLPPIDLRDRALDNFRLLTLPERLAKDIRARIKGLAWDPADEVIVHGDLTGENVLLGPDGAPVLIDFADSVSAPVFYEWPPLVFELFRVDPALVRPFIGDMPVPVFIDALLDGLALHDFGADIIATYAGRNGLPMGAIPTLDALRARLLQTLTAD